MFWNIFFNLCQNNNIKPNAVCKELGFSNATATHWKNGKTPNGDTLCNLADYFNVSVDYLLGRSSEISLNASSNNTLENKIPTDNELQQQIKDNMQKLNSQGLMRLADYSNDLVSSGNYEKKIPSLKIARTAPGNPYVQPYMEDEEDLSKYPETDMDL